MVLLVNGSASNLLLFSTEIPIYIVYCVSVGVYGLL